MRWKATKYLARIKDLHNWQYSLLANECDSRTAIALARVEGVDSRYFVQPPGYGVICNQDYLVHILKDFLMHLENSSKHPCITNFISNSFADVQVWTYFICRCCMFLIEYWYSQELHNYFNHRLQLSLQKKEFLQIHQKYAFFQYEKSAYVLFER